MSQWADDPDFTASLAFLATLKVPEQPGNEDFAADFRRHVVPQLGNLTKAEAFCVHHGVETFSDAHGVVMRHAVELGASRLSSKMLNDLNDAIIKKLADEIDALDAAHGAAGCAAGGTHAA